MLYRRRVVLVDRIQVHKVVTASWSTSGIVWIDNTVCTGYTWSPRTSTILSALATLGAHSPVLYCLHWLHLEPTHLVVGQLADEANLVVCTVPVMVGPDLVGRIQRIYDVGRIRRIYDVRRIKV
jgi:hypothetical protein